VPDDNALRERARVLHGKLFSQASDWRADLTAIEAALAAERKLALEEAATIADETRVYHPGSAMTIVSAIRALLSEEPKP
jgi:hypothetical protein